MVPIFIYLSCSSARGRKIVGYFAETEFFCKAQWRSMADTLQRGVILPETIICSETDDEFPYCIWDDLQSDCQQLITNHHPLELKLMWVFVVPRLCYQKRRGLVLSFSVQPWLNLYWHKSIGLSITCVHQCQYCQVVSPTTQMRPL